VLRLLAGGLARHAVLIGATFLMLYPLLWMVASSFKPESIIFTDLSIWPHAFDFGNYIQGWTALQESFTVFFKNQLRTSSSIRVTGQPAASKQCPLVIGYGLKSPTSSRKLLAVVYLQVMSTAPASLE
jgi:ABC-type glycerol-3-phosphate transport system permease component